MKKLLAAMVVSASCLVNAQDTNAPALDLWDHLTTGSNYWAAPFVNYSVNDSEFGGGIAIGYKISEIISPMVRVEWVDDTWWNVGLTATLQTPRTLMGKIPITPFAVAGIATPFTGAGDENGTLVTIVGGGAAMRFDWVGSGWFWQKSWIAVDYEKWLNMPEAKQDQIRFGLGLRF